MQDPAYGDRIPNQNLLYDWAPASEDDELFYAAFSSLAQSCKTYDEYVHRLSETPTDAVQAVAVALVGPKKKVNKLVGSLPLLR